MNAPKTSTKSIEGCQIILAIELFEPCFIGWITCRGFVFAQQRGRSALLDRCQFQVVYRSSDGIMVAIERLCKEHATEPSSIASIIVSVGPGGYTALRIATTTAKVLAATLGCELVAVPTAIVASVSVSQDQCPALIALASKNQMAHCSLVQEPGQAQVAWDARCTSTCKARNCARLLLMIICPTSFIEHAQIAGVEIVPIKLDARQGLIASNGIEPIAPESLMPIYAREPDAVTQWRDRKKQIVDRGRA